MRVCVVGSGAREHALAVALARSASVVVTPGNPGIAESDGVDVTGAPPVEVGADLVVVGPEAPLVAGLADELRSRGRRVLGPGRDGARLEGSKAFMKELATAAGVPTAAWASFGRADDAVSFLRSLPGPYVVKTDGLAAGKGVLVTDELSEAVADVEAKLSGASFGEAGRRVVVEECLAGVELSVLALCDGERFVLLPPAQDHKRLADGDLGPNTGGMGAFSPVPGASDEVLGRVVDEILEPTVAELRRRGVDYRGVLYAGLMLTEDGPKLIEYNVRFGDPEAEVVLPRCTVDLAELFLSAADGRVGSGDVPVAGAAACVVLAAPGYPAAPVLGGAVSGLGSAGEVEGVTVYHAGTTRGEDGVLRVAGGRVLAVTGVGADVGEARSRAYEAVRRVGFEGMQLRTDIASTAPSGEWPGAKEGAR